jgi:hypothetical protein
MDTYTDTQTDGRDLWSTPLKWAQVSWYTYIPSIIKIGSAIQKLIEGDTETHRQHGNHISLVLFLAHARVSVYAPIVGRQRLGKNPLFVARQLLDKNFHIVARQRLGRNITAVMNGHATIEELLDASFSMWSVSYQKSKRLILPSTSCFKIRKWTKKEALYFHYVGTTISW